MMLKRVFGLAVFGVLLFGVSRAWGQAELAPWGNLEGIRIDGEMVPFESSVVMEESGEGREYRSRHYGVAPSFRRDGGTMLCETELEGVRFRKQVEDTGYGTARMTLEVEALEDLGGREFFFCLAFGEDAYGGAEARVFRGDGTREGVRLEFGAADAPGAVALGAVTGLDVGSPRRGVSVTFEGPGDLSARGRQREEGRDGEFWLSLLGKGAKAGSTARLVAGFEARAELDREEIRIEVDAGNLGSRFDGLGGNFRLQFPDTDPQVIDYCLEHLPLAWSRIGMWWRDWHPEEGADPVSLAREQGHAARVYEQMEMARRLAGLGLPVIVSAWFAPDWATAEGPTRPGTYGDSLDAAKWDAVAESLTAYLLYLKDEYGVEAALFSFNEPDIGVQVAQTPEEHVAMTALLGKRFAKAGLSTKLLLADTSNATPKSRRFVEAGLASADARPYVGAVGFHTWGGCEEENLRAWSGLARALQVPLLVTESGPDSEAHRNPDLFLEERYQQQEIDLYVRLLAHAQPQSIMQWQLTADYSLLSGGGVYGRKDTPLAPTRRFWNFKQLGLAPMGGHALQALTGASGVVAAGFADKARGRYVVHVVNNGAARATRVAGLPARESRIRAYATGKDHSMEPIPVVWELDGSARFDAPANSFCTVEVER